MSWKKRTVEKFSDEIQSNYKMSVDKKCFDLEYDYESALQKRGHKQSNVDDLRSSMLKIEEIPKSITDKQVKKIQLNFFQIEFWNFCFSQIIF